MAAEPGPIGKAAGTNPPSDEPSRGDETGDRGGSNSAEPGLETWDQLRVLGRVTLGLLRDPEWIDRRVETIHFVGSNGFERQVTLDVNGARVREIVELAGGEVDQPVLLPLVVLNKGLLLDVDVRDAVGKALPVAISDVDARAGQAALLACLDDDKSTIPRTDVTTLSPAIRKTIFDAVRRFPSEADRQTLKHPEDAADGIAAWQVAADLSGDPSDVETWASILDTHEEFWSLLVNLTLRFMMMTPIKLDSSTHIVKIKYLERQEPSDLRLHERLGLRTFTPMLVAVPAVGAAAREHCRLDAPDGMWLDSVYLWEVRGGLGPGARARPASGNDKYQRRMTPERVSIYTAGFRERARNGEFWLAFALRPKRSGFLVPAQLALLASMLLLLAGGLSEVFGGRLGAARGDSAAAAVAVLLVVPSVVSAYLANSGEHELLSELLRLPRLGVALASFIALLAGGGLIIGLSGRVLEWTWFVAAGVSAAVLVQLSVMSWRSGSAMRDVLELVQVTEEQPILVLSE